MLGKKGQIRLGAVLLAAAAAGAYSNTFQVPFLFDDTKSILANPSIRRLADLGQVLSPPANLGTGGRPLFNLSLALNYALGGTSSVAGYHAVNLAIHLGCALLLFGVLRRTFALLLPDDFLPALAGAALWALHPLDTNAVTYLSERSEELMALFYLLSLYAFIRACALTRVAPKPGAPRTMRSTSGAGERDGDRAERTWLGVSVLACALGMAAKEVMATAPLLILLYDRVFIAGSFAAAWRSRRAYYAGLAACWAVLLLLLPGLGQRGAGFSLGVSPFAYLLTECRAVLIYLRLAVWPAPLVFDYDAPILTAREAAPWVLGVAALAAVLGWAWRRAPAAAFAGIACLLILAPTSSLVPISIQPIAENRMYLPLAALAGLAAWALARRWGRRGATFGLALAFLGGLATYGRNTDYRSAVSLWTDTVNHAPRNARARYNLGDAYLNTPGGAPLAAAQFTIGAGLDPGDAEMRFNQGVALERAGDPAAAMQAYAAAIRLRPTFAKARVNLGVLLGREGHADEAREQFALAARLDPSLAAARQDLGTAEAETEYREGNALARAGDFVGAIGHYRAAVAARPGFARAHANLGAALASVGRFQEAVAELSLAAKLDPNEPGLERNLEAARAQAAASGQSGSP